MSQRPLGEKPSLDSPLPGSKPGKYCPPYDHSLLIRHRLVCDVHPEQHVLFAMLRHQAEARIPRGLYLISSCDVMKPDY